MKIGKKRGNPTLENMMKRGKTLRQGKNKEGRMNKSLGRQVVEKPIKRSETQGINKKLVN